MTVHRGLFEPGDTPPEPPPSQNLQPGQPGKTWKRAARGWTTTGKDGVRWHLSPEGRVTGGGKS